MITINQEPDGTTIISIESPQERAKMSDIYLNVHHPTEADAGDKIDPDADTPKPEPEPTDEIDPYSYHAGYAAAAGLAAVAYDRDEIELFLAQSVVGWKPAQDGHPFDEAPNAKSQEIKKVFDGFEFPATADHSVEDVHPSIRPAVDSGEPDKEALDTPTPSEGTWTLTQEELDSRLAAEYDRGVADGSTIKRHTTSAMLYDIVLAYVHSQGDEHSRMNISIDDEKILLSAFIDYAAPKLGFEVS